MSETRKLATILVSDISGTTGSPALTRTRRLRALRSDLIDPRIAVHHSRIVKRTGDGSIIEFCSVADAVRCVVEVRNGLGASAP
jgi:adenylate cyclase